MLVLALSHVGGLAGIVATMFVCVFTQGFVIPNTSAAALVHHGKRAGIASGTQGTIQFAMASVPSMLLGLLHPQSAVPMAAIICAATLLSLFARQFIVPRRDHTAQATRIA
jgi:DHA1 family bicyclomycin/chloramphenicol resistance-like MFS transporter